MIAGVFFSRSASADKRARKGDALRSKTPPFFPPPFFSPSQKTPRHHSHPPAADVGLGVKPLFHEHGLDPVRYPRRLPARRLGKVRGRPPREVGAQHERVARLLEGGDLFGLERCQGDALDAVGELATGCFSSTGGVLCFKKEEAARREEEKEGNKERRERRDKKDGRRKS